MPANHASIKLSRDLVDDARREADTFNRSVGAQVEHWARIGRLYENAPGVSVNHVRMALQRGRKIEDMTAEDQDAFFADMGSFFAQPDKAMIDAYAALGAREGAVGADGRGGIVRTLATTRPPRIA